MKVTTEGHMGSRVSTWYCSPSVQYFGSLVRPPAPFQGTEGVPEQAPWHAWESMQEAPLHPFCVPQQSAHQADDLRGWLDCVILCEQVAHILL